MIVRYTKTDKGKTRKLAILYTKKEHNISKHKIDSEALYICDRLRNEGYQSFIVGGAVRDLVIGKNPKDFDIVTDALPGQIKKLFRHSRIIGRRFRLVHVYLGSSIYEVSTFRSSKSQEGDNNSFGTMKEDVFRRDFSINALYYDPKDEYIIDFIGGFKDLKKRKVKPVIPLKTIFLEDPVRLIRAIKYSVMIEGDIPFFLRMRMKKHSKEIMYTSPSRLTEEILKILKMDNTAVIMKKLAESGILKYILPGVFEMQKNRYFYKSIEKFDRAKEKGRRNTDNIGVILQPIIEDFILNFICFDKDEKYSMREITEDVKSFLRPITPPNKDVSEAVRRILKRNGIRLKNVRRPALKKTGSN